jgi:hypothetical protein
MERSLLDGYLYYARRSGYLEGALSVIAIGASGVDPQVAAQRALDAVGEDWLVNGTPPTLPTPTEGSVPPEVIEKR